MRCIDIILALALFFVAPVAFSAPAVAGFDEELIGLLGPFEPVSRILSLVLIVFGVFACIARNSIFPAALCIAVSFAMYQMPLVLASFFGVDIGEQKNGVNLFASSLEWLTGNIFSIGVVLVALIAEVVLMHRAAGLYKVYKQQAVTRYWKRNLLGSLEVALDRFEDFQLIDRFETSGGSEKPAYERSAISTLIREVHEAKCFNHQSKPSLVTIKTQFKGRRVKYQGYGGRALDPFREILSSMPDSLDEAEKIAGDRPGYDDLLRAQVRRLSEGSAPTLLSKLPRSLSLRKG